MADCPKCGDNAAHPSRSRSRWEAWRKEITGKRIYRCPACGWRGWGVDAGPNVSEADREAAARILAPQPPNLRGTALASEEHRPQEIDLALLDRSDVPRQV